MLTSYVTRRGKLDLLYWFGGGGGGLVAKSCLTLTTPRTVTSQVPLSRDSPGKSTRVGCHFLLYSTDLLFNKFKSDIKELNVSHYLEQESN